jgi:hypothetical protein
MRDSGKKGRSYGHYGEGVSRQRKRKREKYYRKE